jgi:RimJ/RimL family protein N-acetyltransferase
MPQPVLHTARLLLVPLADRHLDLEVELDSDPEVMRYLSGRAQTRDEVVESHARRMALSRKVPGLGFFGVGVELHFAIEMAVCERDEQETGRVQARSGLPDHAPVLAPGVRRVIAQTMAVNAASRGVMASAGLSYVRTYFPDFDEPLAGAEQGEVEYELTLAEWQSRAQSQSYARARGSASIAPPW